jgi:hypothetical protein
MVRHSHFATYARNGPRTNKPVMCSSRLRDASVMSHKLFLARQIVVVDEEFLKLFTELLHNIIDVANVIPRMSPNLHGDNPIIPFDFFPVPLLPLDNSDQSAL